jgi:hypothetical protein
MPSQHIARWQDSEARVQRIEEDLCKSVHWFPGEQSHLNRAYMKRGLFGLGLREEEVRGLGESSSGSK